MKFFLIFFGLSTILGSGLITMYALMFSGGLSFALRIILAIILFSMGLYIIIQGVKEFNSRKALDWIDKF